MARVYTPRVNHHVTYYNAAGKPKPGIITAVTSATVVDIRIGRSQTVAAVSRSPVTSKAVNSWRPA